jgi:hypothetical protein
MMVKKRLGEMLMEAGVIGETQLKAALGHQRQWGVRLGQALVDLKLATEADIVRALAQKYGFEVARLDGLEPYALEQAVALLPRDFAIRHNVFPMSADTASVTVAMSDPTNLAVADEIRFRTGRRVKVCIGGDREVAEAVRRHYPGADDVEAIALDLDVDDAQTEALFDPFGGGSKDALEAFFGGAPGEAAPEAPPPARAAPAHPAPAPAPRPTGAVPAQRAPAPAPRPTGAVPAQPAAPAAPAPARPAPSRGQASPAPARTGTVPAQPSAAPAPPVAPRPAAPQAAAPAQRPAPAPAAPAPAAAAPAPRPPSPPPPAGPPAGYALELEEKTGDAPIEPGEPMELSQLQDEEMVEGRQPTRALSQRELAILESLDQLASGAPAQPDIVKPAQAMAALFRLLLRKRLVTELEFLDELAKK